MGNTFPVPLGEMSNWFETDKPEAELKEVHDFWKNEALTNKTYSTAFLPRVMKKVRNKFHDFNVDGEMELKAVCDDVLENFLSFDEETGNFKTRRVTPLYMALLNPPSTELKKFDAAKKLAAQKEPKDLGADPNHLIKCGEHEFPMLFDFILMGNVEAVEFLLDHGANYYDSVTFKHKKIKRLNVVQMIALIEDTDEMTKMFNVFLEHDRVQNQNLLSKSQKWHGRRGSQFKNRIDRISGGQKNDVTGDKVLFEAAQFICTECAWKGMEYSDRLAHLANLYLMIVEQSGQEGKDFQKHLIFTELAKQLLGHLNPELPRRTPDDLKQSRHTVHEGVKKATRPPFPSFTKEPSAGKGGAGANRRRLTERLLVSSQNQKQ